MWTFLFLALLLFGCLLPALVGSLVFAFHDSDAAGQGYTRAYAFFAAILLWLVLGGADLVCTEAGGFPGKAGFIAWGLYLAAAVAHFAALATLSKTRWRDRDAYEWVLRRVVVAIPYLVIVYCIWGFVPSLRAAVPARVVDLTVGVPLLALAAIPLIVMRPVQAGMLARSQALQRAWNGQNELIQEVESLPLESSFAKFVSYAYEWPVELYGTRPSDMVNNLHPAGIGRMRKHHNRQSEVEGLLNSLDIRLMADLPNLDLKMTPALSDAARQCARVVAEKFRPRTGAPQFESIESEISPYVDGIRWMVENGLRLQRGSRCHSRNCPALCTLLVAEMVPRERERLYCEVGGKLSWSRKRFAPLC